MLLGKFKRALTASVLVIASSISTTAFATVWNFTAGDTDDDFHDPFSLTVGAATINAYGFSRKKGSSPLPLDEWRGETVRKHNKGLGVRAKEGENTKVSSRQAILFEFLTSDWAFTGLD